MKDWRDPADYAFTRELDGARWAWELLRRNPAYQRAWAEFIGVWRALEAAYGAPPQRDFTAWRQDPRAWVDAADCPQGECRIDQDKVLIECALGARFGFHKFPPDPADDDPIGGGRLTWRPPADPEPVVVGPGDAAWLGRDPVRVAIGFDLSLPLPEQLERAKRHLQLTRRARIRGGSVTPATGTNLAPRWTCLLRLLDAETAGADPAAAASLLFSGEPASPALTEAHALRDEGYRRIAHLPEG